MNQHVFKCFIFYVIFVLFSVFHEDLLVSGCSDTEGEVMYGLDGEVVAYADFTKGKMEYPQPAFMDPTSYGPDAYAHAVVDQHVCKESLKNARTAMKELTLEPGL